MAEKPNIAHVLCCVVVFVWIRHFYLNAWKESDSFHLTFKDCWIVTAPHNVEAVASSVIPLPLIDGIKSLDILLTERDIPSIGSIQSCCPVITSTVFNRWWWRDSGSDNTRCCDKQIRVCRGCDAVVNSSDLNWSPAADRRSVVDTVKQHGQHFLEQGFNHSGSWHTLPRNTSV